MGRGTGIDTTLHLVTADRSPHYRMCRNVATVCPHMAWRGTPDEAVVYVAAGVIAAQAQCSEDEAIRKLVDQADAVSRTVADTARLVIAGAIRFD